jgi:hypothetical protein
MKKVFDLEGETLSALKLLALDSKRSLDDLASEAFSLLLKKHNRPATLKEALRMSLRRLPFNDNHGGAQKRAR